MFEGFNYHVYPTCGLFKHSSKARGTVSYWWVWTYTLYTHEWLLSIISLHVIPRGLKYTFTHLYTTFWPPNSEHYTCAKDYALYVQNCLCSKRQKERSISIAAILIVRFYKLFEAIWFCEDNNFGFVHPFLPAKSKGNILKDIVDKNVDKDWVQSKALREDIALLGFTPLAKIHGRLDISWNRNIKYRKLLEVRIHKSFLNPILSIISYFWEFDCSTFNWCCDVY